jgi:hypothetical protein
MMDRIGNIKRQRKRSDRAGSGETLAGFSADWPELHLSASKDKVQLLLPSSHLNSIWLNFVKTKSASYMGEVLADAASMNVPTIEFTDYSDRAIEVTEEGSMRPEYFTDFINQDSEKLRSVLTERMGFLPSRDAMTAADHDFQPRLDQLAK